MTTKEKLVSATAKLIQSKGYYGTGVSEILKVTNLPKGSMYHHMPGGKDQLVAEALKYAARERAIVFNAAMKGKGTAVNGLGAVIDVVKQELIDSGYKEGCPVATVSLEVADDHEVLRETCKNLFEFWINAIEGYLIYKDVEGWKEKANSFFTHLEGALLLSKVSKNTLYLDNFKKELPRILG